MEVAAGTQLLLLLWFNAIKQRKDCAEQTENAYIYRYMIYIYIEREREREREREKRERERERKYNKVQACFVLETFYCKFSPLRALSRPAQLS